MLLVFDDKHKEDLEFLKTTNVSIITEFCKIAVNFIKSGANKKLFAGAARTIPRPTPHSLFPASVHLIVQLAAVADHLLSSVQRPSTLMWKQWSTAWKDSPTCSPRAPSTVPLLLLSPLLLLG